MLKRFAPLVPLALITLLAACAGQVSQQPVEPIAAEPVESMADEQAMDVSDDKPYEMPQLADSILSEGMSLIGTKYVYGGTSAKTGFDCSGFVGFLFREEAGIKLPRTTREMIKLDVPLVARDELEPGDVIFFNKRGRGRVSHVGIYLGDDQFLHSGSRRSGGVRVDSLDNSYWSRSYMEAKRALVLASR